MRKKETPAFRPASPERCERNACGLDTQEPRADDGLDAAVAELQALARRHGGGKGGEVDAFIAERRAEAARE